MQSRSVDRYLNYLALALILLTLACSQGYVSMGDGGGENSDALTDNQRLSGDAEHGVVAQDVHQSQSCDDGKEESFPIQASYRGLLDVLIVVDGSQSMALRRQQAAQRLRPLIQKLGNSDYQVAVISSDLRACLSTVITKSTPNAVEQLVTAVSAGPATTTGDFATMKIITGLTNVKSATWDGANVVNNSMCANNWIRTGSIVAMIVISDKKHMCCHKHACTMPDIENALRSIGRIGNSNSQRKLFRLYGLLNQSDEYTVEPSEYFSSNNWYVDWRDFEEYNISGTTTRLVDFVKSIDDPNYDDIFNSITDDLATSLGDTFTLAETHDNRCAHVSLTTDGKAQALSDSEYEIIGKTLTIKRVLTNKDTQVSISYSY